MGPDDIIAFPSVYEVFNDSQSVVDELLNGYQTWAEEHAEVSGMPADALKRLYKVQTEMIVESRCEYTLFVVCVLGVDIWDVAPLVELYSLTVPTGA